MSKKKDIMPRLLDGNVKIPPSKSMAHRAIICACLSEGKSTITNVDFSDDIIATMDAMKSLGAKININKNILEIDGTNTFKNMSKDGIIIDCNESGSTLRFLVPISIVVDNKVNFIGKGNLGKRPLNTYYNIFEKQNISYTQKDNILDLNIKGALKGDLFEIKGNISSQFITGLLFSLPLLKTDSKIIITTKLESKGYIDLTLDMLNQFGIKIKNNDYKEFIIKGNQKFKAKDYRIEGDFSQAAFYFSAAALGSNVGCLDLLINSKQGDKECLEILENMGAKTEVLENKVDKKGDVYSLGIKVTAENLKGIKIDASQCPDIIPVISVVAALSKGETKIINAQRLRIKECDRLNAICTELKKIGANIEETEDGLIINGVEGFSGGEVFSHNDHRIAMSMAIASTRCSEKLTVLDPDCVKKSYPKFWEDFALLR